MHSTRWFKRWLQVIVAAILVLAWAAMASAESPSAKTKIASASPLGFSLSVGPAPTISSLSPTSAFAGSSDFTLTISGTNFTATSTVMWGTTALATNYVSATQLTAVAPASLSASSGTASISVSDLSGDSSAVAFTLLQPPPPGLLSLSPSTAIAGGAAIAEQHGMRTSVSKDDRAIAEDIPPSIFVSALGLPYFLAYLDAREKRIEPNLRMLAEENAQVVEAMIQFHRRFAQIKLEAIQAGTQQLETGKAGLLSGAEQAVRELLDLQEAQFRGHLIMEAPKALAESSAPESVTADQE